VSKYSLAEPWHDCPSCGTRSSIILDLDTGLPVLSASHTCVYFCPRCMQPFWQGKQEEKKGNNEHGNL
jgi:hypothetical protein